MRSHSTSETRSFRKDNYELKVMNGDQGIITRESGQDPMVEFDG